MEDASKELQRQEEPTAATNIDSGKYSSQVGVMQDISTNVERGNSGAREEDEVCFGRHPFTKDFLRSIHCILVSCSRQDVFDAFAHFPPEHQDLLYKIYTMTVTQLHENVVDDFRSICDEKRILEALDHISSREFLLATDVSQSTPPKEALQKVAVERKREKVKAMKQKLQQVQEENAVLSKRLDGLRAKVVETEKLRSTDANQ